MIEAFVLLGYIVGGPVTPVALNYFHDVRECHTAVREGAVPEGFQQIERMECRRLIDVDACNFPEPEGP